MGDETNDGYFDIDLYYFMLVYKLVPQLGETGFVRIMYQHPMRDFVTSAFSEIILETEWARENMARALAKGVYPIRVTPVVKDWVSID